MHLAFRVLLRRTPGRDGPASKRLLSWPVTTISSTAHVRILQTQGKAIRYSIGVTAMALLALMPGCASRPESPPAQPPRPTRDGPEARPPADLLRTPDAQPRQSHSDRIARRNRERAG